MATVDNNPVGQSVGQVAPTAPVTTQQQGPNPAAPQVADVAHHSMIGKAVRSIMGSQVDYSIDPATGKTVATETPEKPGQLFRHILAGAILGGALGSTKKNFAAGATTGAEGVREESKRNDLLKRSQAKEDYENQLKAQENQRVQAREDREKQAFSTEQDLRRATIAHYNASTIREHQLIQGESYTMHDKMASEGRATLEPFITAGANYAFKDVPEDQLTDIMKKNPDAAHYKWAATGTKTVLDKDGNPNYVSTYSAVDPQGKIKITSELSKMFKDVDMSRVYPQFNDVIKPGKELTVDQYMTLMTRYKDLKNQKDARIKEGLDTEEKKASIRLKNAEAAKAVMEQKKGLLETKQSQLFKNALDKFAKVGYDIDKLDPADKLVIGQSADKTIGLLNSAIKDALSAFPPNQQEADELMKQRDFYLHLQSQAMGMKPSENKGASFITPDGSTYQNIPPDQIAAFMKAHPDAKPVGQANSTPTTSKPSGNVEVPNMNEFGIPIENRTVKPPEKEKPISFKG